MLSDKQVKSGQVRVSRFLAVRNPLRPGPAIGHAFRNSSDAFVGCLLTTRQRSDLGP